MYGCYSRRFWRGSVFFFKQKTAYELRISDGSSDVCSSDLFAAGYSACFIGALKFVASQTKRSIPNDAAITAHVGIGQIPGGFGLDIDLHINLPGLDPADAHALVDAANQLCPYSHATRGSVAVRFPVTV